MTETGATDERPFMERAIDLAEEARDRGDDPFGSVLVWGDEIVMTEKNAVATEDDIRRHPELHLATRASREYAPDERGEMVMYTSAEPCPMCAGGLRYAGFDRIVYSVSTPDLVGDIRGGEAQLVRAKEVLAGVTAVEGPVLHERGYRLLEDYYRQ